MKHYTEFIPVTLAEKLKEKGMPIRYEQTDEGVRPATMFCEVFDWFAEQGYKEAIVQAKEWIGNICYKVGFSNETISQCVESFETNMNKLWEEKK